MNGGAPRSTGVPEAATPNGAGRHALAWTLAAVVGAALLVVGWSVVGHLARDARIGDGVRIESYGFDLSNLQVDRQWLVASGHARDFLPALDDPEHLAGEEVAEFNRRNRRRPVVSADRVVGVVIAGESRAYPLPLLETHEIVNDTLGGVPIAVSYSPLADLVVVLDRRIDGETRSFGLSGLLFNATHLLYDRATPGATAGPVPTLFSPLLGSAIAGPRAGTSLQRIPGVSVARWDEWLAAHPRTTVARGDEASRQRGRKISYAHYLDAPEVPFPVARCALAADAPGPEAEAISKAPAIAWRGGDGAWRVVSLADLRASAGADGWVELAAGSSVRVDPRQRLVLLRSDGDGPAVELVPSMRFAADLIGCDGPVE